MLLPVVAPLHPTTNSYTARLELASIARVTQLTIVPSPPEPGSQQMGSEKEHMRHVSLGTMSPQCGICDTRIAPEEPMVACKDWFLP
jgi:hypothetical protein